MLPPQHFLIAVLSATLAFSYPIPDGEAAADYRANCISCHGFAGSVEAQSPNPQEPGPKGTWKPTSASAPVANGPVTGWGKRNFIPEEYMRRRANEPPLPKGGWVTPSTVTGWGKTARSAEDQLDWRANHAVKDISA
ncbi:hypothetical protein MMC30_008958 [Trapelia coarctata]|nr:hypothetical protein [Trapelia coarctata]